MEYRSISAKIPIDELTLFKSYCKQKGVTPASLIRTLILREMKITVPNKVAGRNIISYDREKDTFTWAVERDNGEQNEVLKNVSPAFIEDLFKIIKISITNRNSFIQKNRDDSVSIPSDIFRRDNY